MKRYILTVTASGWTKEKGEFVRFEEKGEWDLSNPTYLPPYASEPMKVVGFEPSHMIVHIQYKDKEKPVYRGPNNVTYLSGGDLHPVSQREISYALHFVKEETVNPESLPGAVIRFKEDATFDGPYAPADKHAVSELPVIEGETANLPGTNHMAEIFAIAEDCVVVRLGGDRADRAKMYEVGVGNPQRYVDRGASGRFEDYEAWDISIEMTLILGQPS